MAWAELRPNGRYRACWRDAGGRPRYTQAKYLSKKPAEAEAWRQERSARLSATTLEMTWAEWSELWLARRRGTHQASTLDGDEARVGKWLMPWWGPVRLDAISTKAVREWVAGLVEAGVTPGSVQKIYHLFSASLRSAMQAEVLEANPCVGISMPKTSPGHERFFEPDELTRVVEWMNRPYSTAVELLVETGFRFGELAGWHWQRVDLAQQATEVVEVWSRAGGHIKGYPKGRKRRWVPLPDRACEILARLPRAEGQCGQVHAPGSARCRSTLVLPSPEGLPLDSHNMRARHWLPALDLAGVDWARQHDLRHTYASWCAQRGVPTAEIAIAMGHSDAYVTSLYTHFANSHLERIRGAMNSVRSDSAPDLLPHAPRASASNLLEAPDLLVGDTGIEPVTPAV